MNLPTMTDQDKNAESSVLKVTNKMGIHARPAAMIVRVANKYSDTEIWVRKDTEQVNGKSIMGLMMLAAGNGSELNFTAMGPSAKELLKELSELFARRFEEA
ncbi:MAG: HPr family phosphocarrier protein [Opitutales bacterium]|tara:strand:+ start:469 stop:774 length:306 start_codon:yes stop_codon:yes gene_type:complete